MIVTILTVVVIMSFAAAMCAVVHCVYKLNPGPKHTAFVNAGLLLFRVRGLGFCLGFRVIAIEVWSLHIGDEGLEG